MSVSSSRRAAWRLARLFVPILVALSFASPRFVAPAESASDLSQRVYLPLVSSPAALSTSWSLPAQIDASGRMTASQIAPTVVLDDSGNAHAMWREECPQCRNYFAYKPHGGAWSLPQPFNDTGHLQGPASMTTDPQGNLFVLWSEVGGPFLVRRSPGGAWSQPEVVPVPTGASDLHIAADGAGRLHLLFKVYQGDYQAPIDLFYSFRDASGAWHTPEKVNDRPGSLTRPNGPSGTPSLAVDGAGVAHAAWREWHNYKWPLYYAYRLPDGSWSRNEVTSSSGENPSLAADSAGNVYLAFAHNNGATPEVRFAFRPVGGTWQPSVAINETARNGRQWYEMEGPSLAVDRGGAVYVVWVNGDGATRGLHFDSRPPISADASDPAKWHADETIATYYDIQAQDLAANSRGDLIAVWLQLGRASEQDSIPKIYAATRP